MGNVLEFDPKKRKSKAPSGRPPGEPQKEKDVIEFDGVRYKIGKIVDGESLELTRLLISKETALERLRELGDEKFKFIKEMTADERELSPQSIVQAIEILSTWPMEDIIDSLKEVSEELLYEKPAFYSVALGMLVGIRPHPENIE
jgi:hypothetical protein